jgi:hypothetical protein
VPNHVELCKGDQHEHDEIEEQPDGARAEAARERGRVLLGVLEPLAGVGERETPPAEPAGTRAQPRGSLGAPEDHGLSVTIAPWRRRGGRSGASLDTS